MIVYARYFQNEGAYFHDLKNALEFVRMRVASLQNGRMDGPEYITRELNEIHERTISWLMVTRDRWPSVAEASHLLNLSFREHGLV
jgi:hypothetical protein